MKYGLFAVNYATCGDPETAVRVARHAEDAGLESIWTGEHFVLPDPQPSGFSMSPSTPFLDTIVALTLLSAETSTIKVASGIIELPLYNPVILAKQLASIDQISRGRLIVGVGAGYVPEEFDALGVDLAERGSRMEEYIDAMRALWAAPTPSYSGRHVSFDGVNAYPRPFRAGDLHVVMGGESAPAMRRAITLAQGWYEFYLTLDETERTIHRLTEGLRRHERPAHLGRLEITITPRGSFDQHIRDRYEELGVDRLVFLPKLDAEPENRHVPVPLDDILRTIDFIASLKD